MRLSITVAAALLAFCGSAYADPFDSEELAHYDVSYAKCEKKFPEMRRHRDDVYLRMYRIAVNDAMIVKLAKIRQMSNYQREKNLSLMHKDSPQDVKKIEQQCQVLWSEVNRLGK